jgi:hypothetical protein
LLTAPTSTIIRKSNFKNLNSLTISTYDETSGQKRRFTAHDVSRHRQELQPLGICHHQDRCKGRKCGRRLMVLKEAPSATIRMMLGAKDVACRHHYC